MEQTYQDEIRCNINDLIAVGRLDKKLVFLFGYSNASEEIISNLRLNGIHAVAILDNDKLKWELFYQNVPVRMPEIVKNYDGNNCIVLIASRACESMVKQLRDLGYVGEIYKVFDYNSSAEYSLSEDAFSRKKQRVLRGIRTLERIREQYPAQCLVVCPYNALGDVYWALSFLPAYCEKYGIKKVTVVVIGSGCYQVARLFQSSIISLNRLEMDEFVQALIFSCEGNSIIAHHSRPYTDNSIRYLDSHFLSFIDCYKYAVYGLDKDTSPVLPKDHAEFTGTEQLRKGKTVIVSPYAKSVVQLPDSFWETLVQDYQQKGYLVCTNVVGKEEPIKGTSPLSVPINQIVSAMEYAGCFIGIRSGLCDILITAKCRKVVVYHDSVYRMTNHKVDEFYDLPGWEKIVLE